MKSVNSNEERTKAIRDKNESAYGNGLSSDRQFIGAPTPAYPAAQSVRLSSIYLITTG